MEIKIEAKILTAESKPYSFEGSDGVSHKIRLSVDGEIYEVRSTESQVQSLKDVVGKTGIAHFQLESRKERLSMKLISFRAK